MATTVFLSPIGNDTPFYANGTQLSGGKLYTFAAGSSTMLATYTDNTGTVANANPIILNSEGYPAGSTGNRVAIWLLQSRTYKFLLQNAAGVTQWSLDNIAGQNDLTFSGVEWISVATSAANSLNVLTSTSFTLRGDQTADALVRRRVRVTSPDGTFVYGTITSASYNSTTALTTVFVVCDGATGFATLSPTVEWGLLKPDHPSPYMDVGNNKAQSVAAAATTPIYSVDGNFLHVTGSSVNITSFGTPLSTGSFRRVIFDGVNTLKHNASTLVLPSALDIITAAGDTADVIADTLTKTVVFNYQRAAGVSVLSPLPYRYHSGCALSNNVGTPATIMDISKGAWRDTADSFNLVLPSTFTKTQSAWAVGTGNGGKLDATAMANDTTYHWFLIRKDADGSIDVGFDTSVSCANIPSGYTAFRRIGSMKTKSGATDWSLFLQTDNEFYWMTPPTADLSTATLNAAGALTLVQVPLGVRFKWMGAVSVTGNNGTTNVMSLIDPARTSLAASTEVSAISLVLTAGDQAATVGHQAECWTNNAGEFIVRGSVSSAATIRTHGWLDAWL